LDPFWSYQLISTANPARLPQNWAKLAELAVLFSWSSKTAPRILIFSIAMGADSSFYLKSIDAYAPAFLGYNNSVLARVVSLILISLGNSITNRNLIRS
jgi:hypothetical protein